MSVETDVVVVGQDSDDRREVRCLGEAKWNTVMTMGNLERLVRRRSLLRGQSRVEVTGRTRLALFSGAGFSDELRELAAHSAEVVLVDLDRLHRGDWRPSRPE